MLKQGLTHISRLVVADCDTALSVGSGDMPVLSTPRMMALMENAAMLAARAGLREGETTVGGHIESSHLRPTPVGATVEATATLTKADGRKLYFDIVCEQVCPKLNPSEGGEGVDPIDAGEEPRVLIGKGTHLRFVVNRDKFMGNLR